MAAHQNRPNIGEGHSWSWQRYLGSCTRCGSNEKKGSSFAAGWKPVELYRSEARVPSESSTYIKIDLKEHDDDLVSSYKNFEITKELFAVYRPQQLQQDKVMDWNVNSVLWNKFVDHIYHAFHIMGQVNSLAVGLNFGKKHKVEACRDWSG